VSSRFLSLRTWKWENLEHTSLDFTIIGSYQPATRGSWCSLAICSSRQWLQEGCQHGSWLPQGAFFSSTFGRSFGVSTPRCRITSTTLPLMILLWVTTCSHRESYLMIFIRRGAQPSTSGVTPNLRSCRR
jgi:hypothetical protein